MEQAVFLDRDGTLVEDTGYLHEKDKVKFFPGVSEAIGLLNKSHFKVIVVTNQAGVARGYFTEEIVIEINNYISELLNKQKIHIDAFYYCPHHIDGVIEKYKVSCYCRKPNPGMIEQAARDFNIDLARSCVIGDNITDIEAGIRAGCRTVFLNNGQSGNSAEAIKKAHYVASGVLEAVQWVMKSKLEVPK